MLDTALLQITAPLNESLRRTFAVAEDLAVVTSLHEQDGSVAISAANRIAVFLVNLERDTLPLTGQQRAMQTTTAVTRPPLCLNLLVMFAAHFTGTTYPEALKLLSATIGFFQSRPVLDHANTPDLHPRIARLAVDIENLGFGDLAHVWGVLGGKYVPSVLYRVRMVVLDSQQVVAEVPSVVRPQVEVAR